MKDYKYVCFMCEKNFRNVINFPCQHLNKHCYECLKEKSDITKICHKCHVQLMGVRKLFYSKK